jgi:hypothetical protein
MEWERQPEALSRAASTSAPKRFRVTQPRLDYTAAALKAKRGHSSASISPFADLSLSMASFVGDKRNVCVIIQSQLEIGRLEQTATSQTVPPCVPPNVLHNTLRGASMTWWLHERRLLAGGISVPQLWLSNMRGLGAVCMPEYNIGLQSWALNATNS